MYYWCALYLLNKPEIKIISSKIETAALQNKLWQSELNTTAIFEHDLNTFLGEH